jgi:probable HAF family extracellular repeat protein
MQGLGDLPGGSFFSEALSISADGSVVVGRSSSDSGDQAFRWTADGGMRKLWDLLLSHGVDPAADGWTRLGFPNGISADGNTIVGIGDRNGNIEAFVAVIPISSPLPGDFNGDNVVDAADYVVWRKTGAGDYNTWRANFGATAAGAAAVARSQSPTTVPEPAAGALALLGVNSILLLRRRSLGRPNKVSLSKDEPCD